MDLLYPSTESTSTLSLGDWFQFDDIQLMNEKRVRGLAIQIQGLSHRGGIELIVNRARLALMDKQQ